MRNNTPLLESRLYRIRFMKIEWAHEVVMRWGMVLGKVISKIVTAICPTNVELSLLGAVTYPIKLHVHSTRPLLLTGPIEDAICGGVIDLHG